MWKFFTREIIKPFPVPTYIIWNIENFNNWFNNPDNNAVYANPGIFLRTDKLSVSHVLDYMEKCYGIVQSEAYKEHDVYAFTDLVRKDWLKKN